MKPLLSRIHYMTAIMEKACHQGLSFAIPLKGYFNYSAQDEIMFFGLKLCLVFIEAGSELHF